MKGVVVLSPTCSFPKLLDQYVGESYGDPVFANWLLVPMQARCDPHFRRLFFTEHPEAIALTRLMPSQVGQRAKAGSGSWG